MMENDFSIFLHDLQDWMNVVEEYFAIRAKVSQSAQPRLHSPERAEFIAGRNWS
jgi:hypothetical protein